MVLRSIAAAACPRGPGHVRCRCAVAFSASQRPGRGEHRHKDGGEKGRVPIFMLMAFVPMLGLGARTTDAAARKTCT